MAKIKNDEEFFAVIDSLAMSGAKIETLEAQREEAKVALLAEWSAKIDAVKKPLSVADKKLRARTFKYLSMWEDIYNKWGWADKSEAEKKDLRHSINVDLFGRYTPPSRLTNEQFSVMRYALELLYNEGILIWSAEMAALAREEGLRRVYIWWIEHAGLDVEGIEEYGAPEYYIAAIARDRFGGISDWRRLDSYRLWQLFITIKNRVKSAQRRGASLWENSEAEPETSENCPF